MSFFYDSSDKFSFSPIYIRIQLLIYFILFLACIYSGKLLHLVLSEKNLDTKKTSYFRKIHYKHNILDRNDNMIATSLPAVSVAINPQKIVDLEYAVSSLMKIFPDLSEKELRKNLNNKQKKFIWIKRNITPTQNNMLNEAGIPSLFFEKDYVRIYPHKNLTSFILGYVDVDQDGLAGIEKSFNEHLKEKELKLTIDLRLQNILYNNLKDQIEKVSAIGGLGIIADVTNGEILAMSSLPDFDPHNPSNHKKDDMFNRASLGVYELGSVFKPITVASAIDAQAITINEKFDSMPPLRIGKYSINDFVSSRDRMINAEDVLVKSSNIGTARIALKMGIVKQKEYLKKFGMFEPILIGLPEKGYPLWPRNWSEINAVTISYGHGAAITPLHLVQTIATIVNKGEKCKLHLILSDTFEDCESVLKKETSRRIAKMMREVVVRGSGKRADIDGYCLGGKTGTSIKVINGRYDRTKNISSFVGAFPMYDPKYIIFISIDEPKGGKFETTGGAVSSSVAKKIVEEMIPIFGLETESEKCFFSE